VSSQIETGTHVPFFCFFVSIRWRDKKAVTLKSRGSGSLQELLLPEQTLP